MSLYIRDLIVQPCVKFYFLTAIFSAISYGIVVVLSGNCFHLLLKKRNIYSNRMRIILLIYVIVMLLSSTWKQIGSIYLLMNLHLTSKYTSLLLYRSFGVPITVIIWGADGFMIWRCLVLYQHVSRGLRVGIIVLLSFLSLATFVYGVATLVGDLAFLNELENSAPPVFLLYAYPVSLSLSTLVNIILAILTISRLVYHQRYVRNTLGVGHGSLYTSIIIMCVESSALMVIVGGLFNGLYFASEDGRNFMNEITPHIFVISPLLIVYRVAIGRAIPPTSLSSGQVMAQIRVSIPVSNPPGQGEV